MVNRYGPFESLVLRLIDDTYPTLAELLDDAVVSDGGADDQDVAIVTLWVSRKGRWAVLRVTSYIGNSRHEPDLGFAGATKSPVSGVAAAIRTYRKLLAGAHAASCTFNGHSLSMAYNPQNKWEKGNPFGSSVVSSISEAVPKGTAS